MQSSNEIVIRVNDTHGHDHSSWFGVWPFEQPPAAGECVTSDDAFATFATVNCVEWNISTGKLKVFADARLTRAMPFLRSFAHLIGDIEDYDEDDAE